MIPGRAWRTLRSADVVQDPGDSLAAPVEVLNSFNDSVADMPAHELDLTEDNMPVMLIRNVDVGLRNGTRLIVKGLERGLLKAIIATGETNVVHQQALSDLTLPQAKAPA